MKGKTKEHWTELCEQAAREQDSDKLLQLVHEINRMLDEKEQRLQREHAISPATLSASELWPPLPPAVM
jgi:hypothetical protein